MGFFDEITEENSSSQSSTTSSATITQEDNSWENLIIFTDDTEKEVVNEITAEDIPDTAISFLWDDIKIKEDMQISEDLAVEDSYIKDTSWFSLFSSDDQSVFEKKDENITSDDVIIKTDTEEKIIEDSNSLFTASIPETKAENIQTQNPVDILEESISKLKTLLDWHSKVRESKMEEVASINSKIADLKQQAKNLSDDAKNISLQEDKVKKMIELFESQK